MSRDHLSPGSHTRLSPTDGYDYNNVELSPEGMKTEQSSRLPAPSSSPKSTSPAKSQEAFPDLTKVRSPKNQNDEAISYIGYRPAGSRRAKVPDLEKGTNYGAPTDAYGHENQSQPGSRTLNTQSGGNWPEAQADGDTKYIKLGWTMAHSEAKTKFLLNVAAPVIGAQDPDLQRRVLWR